MYLNREIFHIFVSSFLLTQAVSSDKITLKDGEITYEYDENERLGEGSMGDVFKGQRIEGGCINAIAIKRAKPDFNSYLKNEKNIYEKVGDHESIPKYYHYFPANSNNPAVFVTELLGNNLSNIFMKYEKFSVVTIMKIGLQLLDALEHIHRKKVIHYDLHAGNMAVGFKNDSRIYIFDFSSSDEFEMYGEAFILKKLIAPPFTVKSPRQDIIDLTCTLIWFLRGSTKPQHIIWNVMVDERNITPEEYEELFGNAEGREALNTLLQMANDPHNDHPDYEAFRNILRTELEKHEHKPNYNKFDWQ